MLHLLIGVCQWHVMIYFRERVAGQAACAASAMTVVMPDDPLDRRVLFDRLEALICPLFAGAPLILLVQVIKA